MHSPKDRMENPMRFSVKAESDMIIIFSLFCFTLNENQNSKWHNLHEYDIWLTIKWYTIPISWSSSICFVDKIISVMIEHLHTSLCKHSRNKYVICFEMVQIDSTKIVLVTVEVNNFDLVFLLLLFHFGIFCNFKCCIRSNNYIHWKKTRINLCKA